MLSLAKNERGIRMASAAIILLPVVCLIYSVSRSATVNLVIAVAYCIFAASAVLAFLGERAEEDPDK